MDFNQDLLSFPSEVHKVIYSSARQITPLERSLTGINDSQFRTSCEDYYFFIQDLLSDMYDVPEAYDLPVLELEQFLGDNKQNGMKRKYPSKTKTLIAKTRNAVDRYMATLSRLAFLGEVHNDQLIINQDVVSSLEKIVNTSASPISLEHRLAALERVGFHRTESGFTSLNHPHMFPAMYTLAQKTKGTMSGFDFYNFTKVEFRNCVKKYKPTYLDYFQPLIKEHREVANAIHQIAKDCGCKETISTFLKVDYKYKGVQVMCIDSTENCLSIRITETYGWDDQGLINNRLETQSITDQNYALRHLWRCSGCSTSHLGQFVTVLGQRNRVCGGGQIGFTWWNPTVSDIDHIRFFIHARCDIIDEMKAR